MVEVVVAITANNMMGVSTIVNKTTLEAAIVHMATNTYNQMEDPCLLKMRLIKKS